MRRVRRAAHDGAAHAVGPLRGSRGDDLPAGAPAYLHACLPACLCVHSDNVPTLRLLAVRQTIFWCNRTRNLLSNLTTNERYNRKRYPHFKTLDGGFTNPFDRGVAANCHGFFCPGVQLEVEASDGLLGTM